MSYFHQTHSFAKKNMMFVLNETSSINIQWHYSALEDSLLVITQYLWEFDNKISLNCKLFQDNFVSGLNFDDKSGKSGKCPICFKMVSKLDRHLRIHYDEKPYACHMCDYRSNQSSNLNTHIRKKHNTIILAKKY